MSKNGIVIVGGGLAAARVAEQLRTAEYTGPVTIVSDEEHLPYDRPPLSKDVLHAPIGEAKGIEDVSLRPAQFYADNDISVRLGKAAGSLNPAARSVTLIDGTELDYDDLVIATGLVPRGIPSLPDLPGIRVLRTFDERHVRALAGLHERTTVPVQLVWGEQDAFFPLGWAREMATTFPDGRLAVIPGAGLFSHEERPAEVAQALLPVLAGRS